MNRFFLSGVLLFCGIANAQNPITSTQALLIDHLIKIQSNQESIPTGPIASLSAMALLGFQVSKIESSNKFANEPTEDFCTITVTLDRGSEQSKYRFRLMTENGFTKSLAAREGKKYSDFSDSYKFAASVCKFTANDK